MGKRFWQTWQEFRQSFSVSESLSKGVETGKAVLEAANTLKEEGDSIEILQSVLQNSSSLLDVLCSPMAQVIGAGLPFVPIGIALLKFARDINQKDPSLEDCFFIVSQAAYLESTKEILSLNIYQHFNWDAKLDIKAISQQIEKLNDVEFNSDSLGKAIRCFHESPLAEAFNQVLLARLAAANISPGLAQILTQRVARNTHRYIIKAWIEAGEVIKTVIQPSLGDWQREQERFQSIDNYLKTHIEQKPFELVFDEKFAFKDIYVPIKAKPVDANGKIDKEQDSLNLDNWAKKILLNPDNLEQVMFIQGGPGRGKSVFCRMFASTVWQQFHPIWTPILIRLRDIDTFETRLENTIKAELKLGFIQSDANWLTNANTRFLFILDGFDELHIETRNNLNLGDFIKQVAGFQKECKDYSEMGHRVIITGRSMALQGIADLPRNLERVEIVEMDGQLQQQWLNKWEALQINKGKTIAFEQFLQSDKCPNEVKKLAQEPLLLYLLAAMYRDGKLDIHKLEQASDNRTAKIIIYQEAVNWVLTKQRSEADGTDLNIEFTKQKPEDLKRILMEAAVCVVQSGGEFASMSMLEARLQEDEAAKALIEKAKEKLGNEALKTALAAFYIRPAEKQEGGVEFFHKSFGEFLFAERLKARLKAWTQYYDADEGRQPIISEAVMNWEIYDLLGYGGLTQEIVDYLMGLLTESQDFPWVELFKRLDKFYSKWCQGKFIDTAEETLPQKKLRQLQRYGIQGLGQRQVDVYAGLNVMILLLELHRYAQGRDELKAEIVFYPSGKAEKDPRTNQLLCIINYSDGLKLGNFINIVGQFLSGANLSSANLNGANLGDANFIGADFIDTNLGNANLSGTNLIGANLSKAYLSSADLSNSKLNNANLGGANLSRAYLSGASLNSADLCETNFIRTYLIDANLSSANLSNAKFSSAYLSGVNLSNANLSSANFSGAYLSDANLSSANFNNTILSDRFFGDIHWDNNTNWENVQGLETAVDVPEALKQQLGLS